MWTDGGGNLRRPRGAVLRPLGLLAAAVLIGLGLWHVLMQDGTAGPAHDRVSQRDARVFDRVAHRSVR
jgi:hypothetical protein